MLDSLKAPETPADSSPDSVPHRLGPDSLVWKYYGDVRVMFGAMRAATTENCLEGFSYAVRDHSRVFTDTVGRAKRTLPPAMKTVYAEDGDHWGHRIRDFHKPVKGRLSDGSSYHALNPELFYWAHATFVDSLIHATDTFIRRLSEAEKEQIFQESKHWFARYGVSTRPQPDTYAEFLRYWEETELRFEGTEMVRYGTGFLRQGLPRPSRIPRPLWRVLSPPLNAAIRVVIVGTLPQRVRECCELPWTDRDERRFQRFAATMRRLNPVFNRLPMRLLYVPWARDAWMRTGVDPRRLNNQSQPAAWAV